MKVVNTIPESPFVDSAIASNWSISTTWFIVNGKPKRTEAGHVICTATDAFNKASALHETIMDCDIWVIHRFYPQFSELLLKAVHHGIKVYIQTWGPDYLPFESRPNLYLPRTSAALHQINDYQKNLVRDTYRRFYWFLKNKVHRKAYSSATGVMFVTPVEQLKFASKYTHMGKLRFVNNTEDKHPLDDPNNKRIMIGHCAWETMNHLDAIHDASSVKSTLEHCTIPLTYGGSPSYNNLVQEASHMIPAPVSIPVDFMPRKDFETLVSSQSIFVHYALRQQAVVNVMNFIYQLGQIVAHPNGIIHEFLKEFKIPHHTRLEKALNSPIPISNREDAKLRFLAFTNSRNRLTEDFILNNT